MNRDTENNTEMKSQDKNIAMIVNSGIKEFVNMISMNPEEKTLMTRTTEKMKKDTLRNPHQEAKVNLMTKVENMRIDDMTKKNV